MALPPPVLFANYKGDVSKDIVGQHMGPNLFKEWFTAVKAWYDPETDMTKVGFAIGFHQED